MSDKHIHGEIIALKALYRDLMQRVEKLESPAKSAKFDPPSAGSDDWRANYPGFYDGRAHMFPTEQPVSPEVTPAEWVEKAKIHKRGKAPEPYTESEAKQSVSEFDEVMGAPV